jgi:hypothetical protein
MTAPLTSSPAAAPGLRPAPGGVHIVHTRGMPRRADAPRSAQTDATEDMIDQALDMTFPASDPPAWTFTPTRGRRD